MDFAYQADIFEKLKNLNLKGPAIIQLYGNLMTFVSKYWNWHRKVLQKHCDI